jgi:hypothetical protein
VGDEHVHSVQCTGSRQRGKVHMMASWTSYSWFSCLDSSTTSCVCERGKQQSRDIAAQASLRALIVLRTAKCELSILSNIQLQRTVSKQTNGSVLATSVSCPAVPLCSALLVSALLCSGMRNVIVTLSLLGSSFWNTHDPAATDAGVALEVLRIPDTAVSARSIRQRLFVQSPGSSIVNRQIANRSNPPLSVYPSISPSSLAPFLWPPPRAFAAFIVSSSSFLLIGS